MNVTVRGYHKNTHPEGFISVMEIYPLAYMISTKDESICLVDNLGKYSTDKIDEKVSVVLHFNTALYPGTKTLKEFTWPVNVSDDAYGAKMVLGNTEISEGSRIGVVTNPGD
ncbi:MAG: hypothetical protein IKN45_11470 [Lachnospiraceae bacterium]|nr:hypothetical protein [Lachnospiraceae bacterium]